MRNRNELKEAPKLPIILGVKRKLSRRNDPEAERADAEYARLRLPVLKRDNWTCHGEGCGFTSIGVENAPAGGMEVHHIDDDHHHNDPINLITLCPFCHMAFTAGRRGNEFAAKLGLLPGVSQGELNLIVHTIWGINRAAEIVEQDTKDGRKTSWKTSDIPKEARIAAMQAFESLNETLMTAERALSEEFGDDLPEIDNPATLYAVLAGLPADLYEQRGKILKHVRLIPQMQSFTSHLDLWGTHVWLKSYPPSGWAELIRSVSDRMNTQLRVGKAA